MPKCHTQPIVDHETNLKLNDLQKVNSQQRTVDLIANQVKDMANQMLSAYNIVATLALDDNWKGIKGRYKELKVVGLEFYSLLLVPLQFHRIPMSQLQLR